MSADDLLVGWIRSDTRDADIADYYSCRVSDPKEAAWRADYTAWFTRMEQAEDAPLRNSPYTEALWAQGREIRERWAAYTDVPARWEELDQMRWAAEDAWAYPPEPMDMPSEPPPGMDPISWRSQLQARDLTGHFSWPETSTSDREGTEPMTEITRTETTDDLHETESVIEQQMRSDFMHAQACTEGWPESYDPADELDYSEYASPWIDRDDRWANEWLYLGDAAIRWRDPRGAAEARLHQCAEVLSPIEARSEEQARYLAEHGIERDESGLLSSHYVTRLQDRESAADTASPLADVAASGNALAVFMANSERDGAER
jgi:hypothetical protein